MMQKCNTFNFYSKNTQNIKKIDISGDIKLTFIINNNN